MNQKLLFVFFGMTLATNMFGCKPVSTAETEANKTANAAQDWNLATGTVVQLQVATETYFKNSLEMVRVSDGKGGLKLNPNYTAKKCGLRKGALLSFKFETTLPTNTKYAIGEVVSIQDEKTNTFDAIDNYCTAKSQGFIFKSDFTFVKATNNAGNQTGTEVQAPTTTNPDTSGKIPGSAEIVGSSTDSNGVLRDGVIYPLEDSAGTYYSRKKVTTPNDDYIVAQTKRAQTLKSSGQLGASFLNLKDAVVYAKDGRSRFQTNFRNHIYVLPGFNAKNLRDWDGKTAAYTLVPTTFDSATGVWCEQINFSGAVRHYTVGAITTCPAPRDEDGLSWLWIKCTDLAALSDLRCGTVSPGTFVSK